MALRALAATLALLIVSTAVGWLVVPGLGHTQETIWKNSYLIPPYEKPVRTLDCLLRGLWLRYDSLWYQRIAERGYENISTPFYPLLPMAATGLMLLGISSSWALLLASRLAAFLAIWGMFRLASADYDERTAGRTVLFWLCWPMSFMLLAGYSEPFLVAAMVWSLVFVRAGRWWPAALCAVLACLSRSTGIALLPALYWLAWQRRPVQWAPLAFASIGPLLFPIYLKLSGLALPSVSYPIYWRTEAAAPWTTLLAAMRALASDHAGFVIFNLTAIVVVALLVFTSSLRTEYKLISACMVLFLLTANTTPPLHSMMRYSMAIFPAFIALGARARASWAVLLVAATLAMVNLLMLFFFFDWAYIV